MCNIRSGFADVSSHLTHDGDVLVAVEKGEFFFFRYRADAPGAHTVHGLWVSIVVAGGSEDLEAGFVEDDDEALGGVVVGGYGDMLRGNKLW